MSKVITKVGIILIVILIAVFLASCSCEHEFGNWMIETSSTCITEGKQVRICSACNKVETAPIPIIHHSYGEWHVTEEATCTEQGVKTQTCSGCGATQNEAVPIIDHSFGDWYETKAATCSEEGIKTQTCSDCGTIREQSVPVIDHSFGDWKVTKAATCTENGIKTKECSGCGATQEESISAEHSWRDATCTTPETCGVCGVTTGTSLGHSYIQGECDICGEEDPDYAEPTVISSTTSVSLTDSSQTVSITLLNWDSVSYEIEDSSIVACEWGGWDGDTTSLTFMPISSGQTTVWVYPTGLDGGLVIYVSVKAQAHEHSYTKTVMEPTCTEQGYTYYSCGCGYAFNSDYVDAVGHTEVVDDAVPATPTSTGLTEGKHCSVCGAILAAQQVAPKDTSALTESTTFELTNDLSEEYIYVASKLYTKCKLESVNYDVSYAYGENINLDITLLLRKTYQGEVSIKNIKIYYTLYRNGVAVKTSTITIQNTELGTLYEATIRYTGQAGNYTLTCDSVRY